MRIQILCHECNTVLRYEVKKYDYHKNEVDYIVYPCQTCLDKELHDFGKCSDCEEPDEMIQNKLVVAETKLKEQEEIIEELEGQIDHLQ